MEISEEQILRRYGTKWNIEVYFKTCKQYLKLLKECNSPSFDAFTCHLAIVAVRYMILSVSQRGNSDDRTIGELFWILTEEAAEISYNQSLCLILQVLLATIQKFFHMSDEQLKAFTISFFYICCMSKILRLRCAPLRMTQGGLCCSVVFNIHMLQSEL